MNTLLKPLHFHVAYYNGRNFTYPVVWQIEERSLVFNDYLYMPTYKFLCLGEIWGV